MDSYYSLASGDAKRFLAERDGDEPVAIEDVQRLVGSGPVISTQPIEDLYNELDNLRGEYPIILSNRDREGGKFEQQACARVHQALSQYPMRMKADPEFWIWLAVSQFSEIVEWRFASAPQPAKLENYGIGKPMENLIFRMWLRGEIGFHPDSTDPYELAKAGDQDLWRSHIIRQGYGNSREIAKALLRLQAGKLGAPRLDRDNVRELAKRLKRLRANVFFEVLPGHQADALVLELSSDLGVGKGAK